MLNRFVYYSANSEAKFCNYLINKISLFFTSDDSVRPAGRPPLRVHHQVRQDLAGRQEQDPEGGSDGMDFRQR